MIIFDDFLRKLMPNSSINERENVEMIISDLIRRSDRLIHGGIFMGKLLSEETITHFFRLLEVYKFQRYHRIFCLFDRIPNLSCRQ